MDSSEPQTVRVQKIFAFSRSTETPRFPALSLACRAERNAWTKNDGRYRHDRTRRRVIEMKGIFYSFATTKARCTAEIPAPRIYTTSTMRGHSNANVGMPIFFSQI